jgi:alpha-D-ribose 1-methylphosphonate 5-triphosphate synthase subunit PhnL
MNQTILDVQGLSKTFTLHNQGQTSYEVLKDINLRVYKGECIVLHGPSGMGKSTLLRCLYASYLCDTGHIHLYDGEQIYDITQLNERVLMQLRRHKIVYVSQFLRIIPRVPCLQIVMQPMLDLGYEIEQAEQRATELLNRLNIPERLWSLSPTTFSGGEQQRINIAREFTVHRPLMLLDEPTASLDTKNRETVVELILQAKSNGSAIIGIFHDEFSRKRVADRLFDLKTGAFYE